jgi:hypothetical protein
MLKAELEKKFAQEKAQSRAFEAKIKQGLMNILDTHCDRAIEPIREFCEDVGIDYPMVTKTYKIPYGIEVRDMYDVNGDEVEFIEH